MMKPTLRGLMEGLIDYAGLFPPASLSFDAALNNFIAYRDNEESWILSRFICPVNRLSELHDYSESFTEKKPLRLSVLGKGGSDLASFLTAAHRDVTSISEFQDHFRGSSRIEAFEVKLPEEFLLFSDINSIHQSLKALSDYSLSAGFQELRPFIEVPIIENWRESNGIAVQVISRLNHVLAAQAGTNPTIQFGYKIRCGGLTADAFPSPEQIAHVLTLCRDYQVAVKATAGLHHPVRHYNPELEVMEHGFFNIVTASLLAGEKGLKEPVVQEIIEDEIPEHFVFTDSELFWKTSSYSVPLGKLAGLREKAFVSYGSCSFDEPREDLHTLNLL